MEVDLDMGCIDLLCSGYEGNHFPSDIIVGAFLGICTGTLTAKIFELFIDSRVAFQKTIFRYKRSKINNRVTGHDKV